MASRAYGALPRFQTAAELGKRLGDYASIHANCVNSSSRQNRKPRVANSKSLWDHSYRNPIEGQMSDQGYGCSIWDSVSRLWTKDIGTEVVNAAQCSLPIYR